MLGISPLSPSLVEGFAPSRLEVALIVPSIYPGGLFFSAPGVQLTDRFGVRTSLLGGLAIAAPGLLARAWARPRWACGRRDVRRSRGPPGGVFFAAGLALGMVQTAVLSYLPLYAVQALGFDAIQAGLLVACSQAEGAVIACGR